MTTSSPNAQDPDPLDPAFAAAPQAVSGPAALWAPRAADWAGLHPAGPSPAEMAEQETILAEEIAAGIFEPPPGDELDRMLADPDCGPPEGAGAWLGSLASPARDAILDARGGRGRGRAGGGRGVPDGGDQP